MSPRIALAAALAISLYAPTVESAEPDRAEFAYALPLDVDGRQPAYQLTLPLHVYQNTSSLELADLRVLNGAAQPVPFALSEPQARSSSAVQAELGVPIYPLLGLPGASVDTVRVTLRRDGETLEVQGLGASAIAGAGQIVVGYLLDTRALSMAIVGLTPHWQDTEPDFSATVDAEASDDLQHWRPVAAGQLAHLHFNGQRFLQQKLELPPSLSRYWRLSWPAGQAAPRLDGITVTPAPVTSEPTRSDLLVRAVRDDKSSGAFTVDLGAHLPVDRVNLVLPELNTSITATLYSRADSAQAWTRVGEVSPYRLRAPDGSELANAALPIGRDSDRYWRIVVTTPVALGAGVPVLEVLWVPHTLSFLARGKPPFELVYGRPGTPAAGLRAQTMLAGLAVDGVLPRLSPATLLQPQPLAGPAALRRAPAPPWKKALLWAALLLGAAVLLAMAWQLQRELARGEA